MNSLPENRRLIELVGKDKMTVREQCEAINLLLNHVISFRLFETLEEMMPYGTMNKLLNYAKKHAEPPVCKCCGRPLED